MQHAAGRGWGCWNANLRQLRYLAAPSARKLSAATHPAAPTPTHPAPVCPQVPDWVIIPGGNLGNIYAFYKGFKMAK